MKVHCSVSSDGPNDRRSSQRIAVEPGETAADTYERARATAVALGLLNPVVNAFASAECYDEHCTLCSAEPPPFNPARDTDA